MADLLIVRPLAFLLVVLVGIGCHKGDEGIEPQPRNPRDFVWTIDTISYPGYLQTIMLSVWGSSKTDVYVVGYTEGARAKMHHFDGRTWNLVPLHTLEGGPIPNVLEVSQIRGTSSNNIYAVGEKYFLSGGDSSILLRFDGARWKEIPTPGGRSLKSVWIAPDGMVRLGGLHGTLFTYDGNTVRRDSVPFPMKTSGDPPWGFYSITGSPSAGQYLLLWAPTPEGYERSYLFDRTNGHWNLADSLVYGPWRRIWAAPTGELFVAGSGLARRDGGTWTQLLSGALFRGLYGVAADNFFVVGRFNSTGAVYHYNGSDCFEYANLRLPGVTFTDVWTDGTEAFVVGSLSSKVPEVTIVAHGR